MYGSEWGTAYDCNIGPLTDSRTIFERPSGPQKVWPNRYADNFASQSNCFVEGSTLRRGARLTESGNDPTKNPYTLNEVSKLHNPDIDHVWEYSTMRPVIPSAQTYDPLRINYWLSNQTQYPTQLPPSEGSCRISSAIVLPEQRTGAIYGRLPGSYGNSQSSGPNDTTCGVRSGYAYSF
jgi:hypothetical protein